MNKTFLRIICLFSVSGTLLFAGISLAQSLYPSNILNMKGNFSRGAATAMGEPFQGVRTSAGILWITSNLAALTLRWTTRNGVTGPMWMWAFFHAED